ncbi:MAG TPA: hypothetical protein VGS08_06270 [Candidatus Saccharimonadales bacterium]|nr:hypothetical protein [Candidatus Saccharimonadales bacterium]
MSERLSPSHFNALLDDALAKDRDHPNGIAVSVVSPLMSRSDGLSVFDEGARYSGVERQDQAAASVTVAASPYMEPVVVRDRFLAESQRVFGEAVHLPDTVEVNDRLPAHLIVWWRDETGSDDGRADISALAAASPARRRGFETVVAAQTLKAVRVLASLTGRQPLIEGSWGHGTQKERAHIGMSRGGPSNKHGHLHVLDFGTDPQNLEHRTDLTSRQKLNHFSPWEALLHQALSVPLERIVETSLTEAIGSEEITVKAFSDVVQHAHGKSSYNNGYRVELGSGVPLPELFGALVSLSGRFDALYQDTYALFAQYHKSLSSPAAAGAIRTKMSERAMQLGFRGDEADSFTDFVLRIRPTFGQLVQWQTDETVSSADRERIARQIARYERVRKALGRSARSIQLATALIEDTLRSTEDWKQVEVTWPAHAAALYALDNYTFSNDTLKVQSLILIPKVGSTESAEHIYGGTFKRATGN